ncbi:MAG: restriction endonuclease subunit S [Prevotella sp.]|nr:restriction endonuclease subunit S [Prevotella sp.]
MIETRFKDTEIGKIPEEWEVKTLGEIVTFLDNYRIPIKESNRVSGIYPYYGASGIIDYVNKYIFDGDYILLGEDGANIIDRNSPLAFEVHGKCWINNHAHVLSPGRGINLTYLTYFLESQNYEAYNTGTAQPKLNRDKCNIIPISIPTEIEQRRIATSLSDVDALISAIEKKIEKKKLIKQGAMQQLLTGKKRLPGYEGEWVEKRLGEVSDIKTGSSNAQDANPNGKYPFFIRSEKVERSDKYIFDCEAILIPGEGKIGEVFHYINGKFDCHQRVYKISNFKEIEGKYIFHYMRYKFKEHAMKQTVKATVDSLRLPLIQSFNMRVPSDISEQRAIASVLSNMDSEITALERKRDKLKEVKQGMMQQLLTGKIRLV